MTGILAWGLAALAVTFGLLTVWITSATPWTELPGSQAPAPEQVVPMLVYFLVAPVVGAFIVSRSSRNAIGWLFIIGSGGLAFGLGADSLATYLLATSGDISQAAVVRWLGNWLSVPGFASVPLLALLFPNGRPPSARWTPAIWSTAVGAAALVAGEALKPEILIYHGVGSTGTLAPNPLRLEGTGPMADALEAIALALILGGAIVGIAGLVVRFRRSRGAERQQLKWFVFAMAVVVGLLIATAVAELIGPLLPGVSGLEDLFWPLAISSLALLPVSAAIAITRYRLYDIDVLINRAVVYAVLTIVLGAMYVALVIGAQALLGPLTGGNQIAVAASTLVVVALFQPLRARIQGVVDRRFYRSRYDAQRTLDTFTTRLREHVDLGTLEDELVGVIERTVQPAHASLWLRG